MKTRTNQLTMAVLATLIQTVTVLFVFTCDIKCEKTADQVYALLDERLNNIAFKIYDIEEEITTQVGAIHQRIDHLETQITSNTNINEDIEQSDGGSMKMKNVDVELKMKRGLAAEKYFVRKMLKKYQDQFNVFKNNIDDQINAINDTIVATNVDIKRENKETTLAMNNTIQVVTETSKVNIEKQLENTTVFINKALNELKSESEDKLQDYDKLLEEVVTKVGVVESQLKDTVDNRIKAVETKINIKVIFYGSTGIHSQVTQTKHIRFSYVHRNEGNGYSKVNGEFIAPRAGVYLLYVNIVDNYGTPYDIREARCYLYRNSSVIATIDSETDVYFMHIEILYNKTRVYVKCSKLSWSSSSGVRFRFAAILLG